MHDEELEGYDWNEGEPDHEGEMATSQLHRIVEMAEMLLEIISEGDELPGWVQYKFGRAYSDLNDAFGYIESMSHELEEAKKRKSCSGCKGKNPGLWCNMCKRRKAGKPKKKPGQKGYPKTLKIEGNQLRSLIEALINKELK